MEWQYLHVHLLLQCKLNRPLSITRSMDMYVINITSFFRYSFYQRFYAKYFQSYLQKIYMNRYKPIPEPLLTKHQYRLCQYCMYNLSYWLGVWKWILKKFTKVNKKHIYICRLTFLKVYFSKTVHTQTPQLRWYLQCLLHEIC